MSGMSRTEMLRLLDACKRDPHDDTARLVLADWLEENGDEAGRARARLIRLQVPDRLTSGLPDLRGEQEAIGREHRAAWDGEAAGLFDEMEDREQIAGLDRVEVSARVLGQKRWRAVARSEGWAWVEQLKVSATRPVLESPLLAGVPRLLMAGAGRAAQWRRVAESPGLGRLRSLLFDHGDVPDKGLEAVVSSPHLQGLRELALFPADPSGPGLACLEGRLPELDTLNICGIPAGYLPPEQLARVLGRPMLRELDLRTTSLTTPHVRALSEVLPGLRKLWLSRVRREGRSFDLASAGFAAGLDFLMLHEYRMTAASYKRLGGLAAGRLRCLLLWEMGMDAADVRALADAGMLGRLTLLDINRNRFGEKGAVALAKSGQDAPLSLDLSSCGLDNKAAAALARWPGLARCRVLKLSDNGLTVTGLRALAESPHTTGLLELDVSGQQTSAGGGLAAVVGSPLMRRLESLRAEGLSGDMARLLRAGPELPRLRNLEVEGDDALRKAMAEKCPNAHLEE
jgi:uncharacterized protein (TIGR02996 family)